MTNIDSDDVGAVAQLVKEISPLFAGKDPAITGGALADLLAIWLASHIVPGSPRQTERWRKTILELHIETVRRLVEPNERIIQGSKGHC